MVVRLGFLGNSRVVVSHVGGGIECTFHTLVGCRKYSKKKPAWNRKVVAREGINSFVGQRDLLSFSLISFILYGVKPMIVALLDEAFFLYMIPRRNVFWGQDNIEKAF